MKAQTFSDLHCEVRSLTPMTIVYGVDFVVGAGDGTEFGLRRRPRIGGPRMSADEASDDADDFDLPAVESDTAATGAAADSSIATSA